MGRLLLKAVFSDPYVDVAPVGRHRAGLGEPQYVELNDEISDDVASGIDGHEACLGEAHLGSAARSVCAADRDHLNTLFVQTIALVLAQANCSLERNFARLDRCVQVGTAGGRLDVHPVFRRYNIQAAQRRIERRNGHESSRSCIVAVSPAE